MQIADPRNTTPSTQIQQSPFEKGCSKEAIRLKRHLFWAASTTVTSGTGLAVTSCYYPESICINSALKYITALGSIYSLNCVKELVCTSRLLQHVHKTNTSPDDIADKSAQWSLGDLIVHYTFD